MTSPNTISHREADEELQMMTFREIQHTLLHNSYLHTLDCEEGIFLKKGLFKLRKTYKL